jgi:hypothetical protein
MTPHTQHLAEQASLETDPAKLLVLVNNLCTAIDNERTENRHLRQGCVEDCREHHLSGLGT